MLLVVRPEGLILWYDVVVENPWNSCVHPLHRSEIRSLFPGCALELQRVTWPSLRETRAATVAVIVASAVAAVILGVFDMVWSWLSAKIY